MSDPLRLGIAGLGTVGAGVLILLQEQQDLLRQRCGRALQVTAVSSRDRYKNRGVDLASGVTWHEDARALAKAAHVDVVIELIGGAEGIARQVVETALDAGKHVVTANKALLALHGSELAARAEKADRALCYEAAVGGGIPVVKAIREGLAANRFERVYGILNGTCNYILTKMENTGDDFDKVLLEAQGLGYAEADPSFDVDGIDTAHKLSILASLAYGTHVDFPGVYIEGIRHIGALDIQFAREFGYRIKLLGLARRTARGIEQRVHPCMAPLGSPISEVGGVTNAVVAVGNYAGQSVFEGPGAGAGPTASAVIADIVDIARNQILPPFAAPSSRLERAPASPMDLHQGAYYVRLTVLDQPGVMAAITAIMAEQGVSIDSIIQRGRAPGAGVPVVLITHETEEARMNQVLAQLTALKQVTEPPVRIRIEKL
ncbi:MAG: homoserine dehydrogenase [Alphaproteobacteria bacterium]|nr:homoserine dehydrogenase [Alphaproteobacteria bacterium]